MQNLCHVSVLSVHSHHSPFFVIITLPSGFLTNAVPMSSFSVFHTSTTLATSIPLLIRDPSDPSHYYSSYPTFIRVQSNCFFLANKGLVQTLYTKSQLGQEGLSQGISVTVFHVHTTNKFCSVSVHSVLHFS